MEQEPTLQRSVQYREVNFDNPKDPGIITIDRYQVTHLEEVVPYDQLLTAVQTLEEERKRNMEAAGYPYPGCGQNPGGLILGGPFGHVLEHAVCAVLEKDSPLNEFTRAFTVNDGINTDKPFEPAVIHRYHKILIAPVPSENMRHARAKVKMILKLLENQANKGNIDLCTITHEVNSSASRKSSILFFFHK